MKILTIHQAVEEIKKNDPNSDISTTMLNRLINEKKLPYGSRGNRTVIEWFILIASLNELLKFTGESFLPQIRTIRNAATELKQIKPDLGVSESHIRRYVEDEKIGFISIGNRHYVAMQSFSFPYSESLIYGEPEDRAKREMIKKDIMAQLSAKITANCAVPIVQRKSKRGNG